VNTTLPPPQTHRVPPTPCTLAMLRLSPSVGVVGQQLVLRNGCRSVSSSVDSTVSGWPLARHSLATLNVTLLGAIKAAG
jgi:hypothetical protein